MAATLSGSSRFAGKTCIVTGAGKGIGRALVKDLLGEGIQLVVAITRSQEDCASLDEELGAAKVRTVQADLGRAQPPCDGAMSKALEILKAESLGLDYLVNNAGVALNEPLLETSQEKWETTMRVNAYAPLHCTQAAVRYMLEGPGGDDKEKVRQRAIVNVSSMAGKTALQDHTSYCMSKAAMDMLTQMTALELGPKGIRCNAVNPTVVLTKMGKEVWSDPAKGGPLMKQIPMERFASESEVVRPVLFLLDAGQSGMINGQSLLIEGGLLGTTKLK